MMNCRNFTVACLGATLLTVLIAGTPTKAKGCTVGTSCLAESYPYNSVVDQQVDCTGSKLDSLGNRQWLFHCCAGSTNANLDLYITMPDDSTPSDIQEWSAGNLL